MGKKRNTGGDKKRHELRKKKREREKQTRQKQGKKNQRKSQRTLALPSSSKHKNSRQTKIERLEHKDKRP